ncbi:unnamed protein product [Nippostrongylus brasiliensis]|uniref:MARVEL domain-containing protein n=1 Tax=Nippostrongylus brasiliensis TaxID=27835 RepID=A0A0N4XUJ5_NIPBR|nr:unnamed protein product [Nippostrongylus brasiliensis]
MWSVSKRPEEIEPPPTIIENKGQQRIGLVRSVAEVNSNFKNLLARFKNWKQKRIGGSADYYRAQAAIGVIALFILLSTNTLALYTFYHHRYVYKRLVACLFLVVAMAIVVTVEVLSNSVDEWNTAVAQASQQGDFDYDAVKVTGYSTRMAQGVVAACLFSAIAFAVGSHKQKGENAATAEFEIEDRPVHIGR